MTTDATASDPLSLSAVVDLCRRCIADESIEATARLALERILHLLHPSPTTFPTSATEAAPIIAEVGYDVLHELLPLLPSPSEPLQQLSGSLLQLISAEASPREIFLPLLSHLSSSISLLSSSPSPPSASALSSNRHLVRLLLPSFLLLLTREKHERRRQQQLHSLWETLLPTALALSPSANFLSELATPLLPLLSPSSSAHVAIPLALLSAYLPSAYPLIPPSPPPPVVESLLSFLSSSPLLALPSLVPLVRRSHHLEGRLSQLRSESWEVTEETEVEMKRRTEEKGEGGGGEEDDWAESEEAEGEEESEKGKRAELRTVKAELAALPQWNVDCLTCYLLLLTHLQPSSVAAYVHSLSPSEALPLLVPFILTLVNSSTATQGRTRMFVDLCRVWMTAVEAASLPFSKGGEDEKEEPSAVDEPSAAAWMLAECLTTSLTQGIGVASNAGPSLLLLFLSRFEARSRLRLQQSLIMLCPYAAVQAVLISNLKELTLQPMPSSESPSTAPPLSSSELCSFLLSLLSVLARPSPPLVDPLLATLNLFRFLLLRPPPFALTAAERQLVTVGVRAVQHELTTRGDMEKEGEDLSVLMMRDLLSRVLELS